MKRRVESEWLDELPAEEARAVASRRDLRRVNAWMGHAMILGRALSNYGRKPRRIVELGAGDGTFMLAVAHRTAARWSGVETVLVDQQDLVSEQTRSDFGRLGWTARCVTADVFDWLESAETSDITVANLFLHHFEEEQLRTLLRLAAGRTDLFAACEPRRSGPPLLFSRLLWLIGCNRVTRHDAVVSVRAGFSGRELSALWPPDGRWRLEERAAGLFSQLFVAKR
ncbi:MAG TPA: methyltransferase domain-containing protein [Verrucomicrobiae bacterium]|jgi:hypothetical protein